MENALSSLVRAYCCWYLYCSMGVYQCVCTLPYDSKLEEQQVYSAAASLLLVGCLLLLPAAGGDDEGAAAAVLAS